MKLTQITKVIQKMNSVDPMNPEVLVKGVGRYDLDTLKLNVRKKLEDLHRRIEKSDDASDWRTVAKLVEDPALLRMMQTITVAHDELQGIRKENSDRSKGIKKE